MSKNIMIIGASTRPERMGTAVVAWVEENLKTESPDSEIQVVDLEKLGLPFLDEPQPPMQGNYTQDHTKAWAAQVAAADGFIIVTPEYNAGYPAPLKNAIDFLYAEWSEKPVAFVGYGAGPATNSIKQLKEVTERLKMQNVEASVAIPQIWEALDDKGAIKSESVQGSIVDLIKELNTKLSN
ncbi:MAG: NAD(P)H-dependent FMN reductase [Candidatus Saccharimonadales bacterium]|jgi:NAD(P)H-dependent FMN reductase